MLLIDLDDEENVCQREVFLEEAIARTTTLQDGQIMPKDNPYAAGKERERFNPINGRKYLYGKNHNSTEGLNIVDQTNLTIPENKGYQGNRRNNRGKGFNRSVSPYQKPEDREKETNFKKNFSGRGNWKSKNKGEGSSKDLEKPNDKE
ncbi:hypothetical protein DFH28DRAFT_932518 [Melampsora americana]|nr:hypothetical protein DFH28DRAFT_932518 [Melampsora americana]